MSCRAVCDISEPMLGKPHGEGMGLTVTITVFEVERGARGDQ